MGESDVRFEMHDRVISFKHRSGIFMPNTTWNMLAGGQREHEAPEPDLSPYFCP